jgi:hypothetical protein
MLQLITFGDRPVYRSPSKYCKVRAVRLCCEILNKIGLLLNLELLLSQLCYFVEENWEGARKFSHESTICQAGHHFDLRYE